MRSATHAPGAGITSGTQHAERAITSGQDQLVRILRLESSARRRDGPLRSPPPLRSSPRRRSSRRRRPSRALSSASPRSHAATHLGLAPRGSEPSRAPDDRRAAAQRSAACPHKPDPPVTNTGLIRSTTSSRRGIMSCNRRFASVSASAITSVAGVPQRPLRSQIVQMRPKRLDLSLDPLGMTQQQVPLLTRRLLAAHAVWPGRCACPRSRHPWRAGKPVPAAVQVLVAVPGGARYWHRGRSGRPAPTPS